MFSKYLTLLSFGLLLICGSGHSPETQLLAAEGLTADEVPLDSGQDVLLSPGNEAEVYIFLAEGCRISQDYSPALRSLHAEFTKRHVKFFGIFPNAHSSDSSIAAYKLKYKIPFELHHDVKQSLTKKLAARITPEAIVTLSDGTVVYRGRINDLFYALGRKRTNIQNHDLREALIDLVAGRLPEIAETKAIGCLIERPKQASTVLDN